MLFQGLLASVEHGVNRVLRLDSTALARLALGDDSLRFADHHRFSQQEILNAINRGKKRQAELIITTQKDAVRFPKLDRRDLPIYFMRVEIKIISGEQDASS